ncbi:MAG TPA: hypothetical protein IAC49_06110 [Candidatus Ventricola intestinavium]|nr:hypothetical protein [Candidatus Ventricola intestinavium]
MDPILLPRDPGEIELCRRMQRHGDEILRLCAVCLEDGEAARRAASLAFIASARNMQGDVRMGLLRLAVGQIRRALGPLRWRIGKKPAPGDALFDRLMALSPRDRALLVLRCDLGLSAGQAARILRMRPPRATRRVNRLCRMLEIPCPDAASSLLRKKELPPVG